jgi:RNA polymerase sigma-70 factor (ECF subfamily)
MVATGEDAEVSLTDEMVMQRLAAGDAEALGALYDRYGRLTLWLANQTLSNPAQAEDAVQDVFVSIWQRAATYDPDRGSVRTWILSSVRHRCIDFKRASVASVPIELDREVSLATSAEDVWDSLAPRIVAANVRRALNELPEDQRAAVCLAYYYNLTQVQIASLLRIPLGTVKGRTRLALSKLRCALAAEAPAFASA